MSGWEFTQESTKKLNRENFSFKSSLRELNDCKLNEQKYKTIENDIVIFSELKEENKIINFPEIKKNYFKIKPLKKSEEKAKECLFKPLNCESTDKIEKVNDDSSLVSKTNIEQISNPSNANKINSKIDKQEKVLIAGDKVTSPNTSKNKESFSYKNSSSHLALAMINNFNSQSFNKVHYKNLKRSKKNNFGKRNKINNQVFSETIEENYFEDDEFKSLEETRISETLKVERISTGNINLNDLPADVEACKIIVLNVDKLSYYNSKCEFVFIEDENRIRNILYVSNYYIKKDFQSNKKYEVYLKCYNFNWKLEGLVPGIFSCFGIINENLI